MDELRPIDHTHDLNEEPDERDLGYGIEVAPDGELRQGDPPNDEDDDAGL